MKSEDARHVSRDRAGEMGSSLGTTRCLNFNHQAQYLDFVFRKQGSVMKWLGHDVLILSLGLGSDPENCWALPHPPLLLGTEWEDLTSETHTLYHLWSPRALSPLPPGPVSIWSPPPQDGLRGWVPEAQTLAKLAWKENSLSSAVWGCENRSCWQPLFHVGSWL